MAEVTVRSGAQVESEVAVRPPGTGTVVGPSGRSYGLKKLSPFDQMLVFEALGSQLASNGPFLTYAMIAFSVTSIDGDRDLKRTAKREIMMIVQRIGDDWDAVTSTLESLVRPVTDDEAAAIKN